jgi:hypothetical protein
LVKTAVAVFACTGEAFSDQYGTTVRRPFCRPLMPKCHSESHLQPDDASSLGDVDQAWLTGWSGRLKKR